MLLVYFLRVTKWRASFSSTCDLISPLLTSSPHPSTGQTVATSEHCSVCEGIRHLEVHKIHFHAARRKKSLNFADRLWFSRCFVLNGVSISSLSVMPFRYMTWWPKQNNLRCLFIGFLKNEAYFNAVQVICKPMDCEWALLLFIVLWNLSVYIAWPQPAIISMLYSLASLSSDDYSWLHCKKTISRWVVTAKGCRWFLTT